jgi:Zn-dependent peptidase ImmA (M78 family)
MKIKTTPNKNQATNEAIKTLDKYCVTSPVELPFLEVLGSENVWYQERKLSGCLGNMVRHKQHGIITISSDLSYVPQKRFVIAHELGHWLLHKDVPNFNCDDKMLHQWHGGGVKIRNRSKYLCL